MLDLPETSTKLLSPVIMSRKRTRSRSEDNVTTSSGVQNLSNSICKPAPFHDEPDAIRAREQCDYTQRITFEMARNGKASRPVRVYADGIYDLFHQGHARQLLQAKNLFPNVYLIVGVCNDKLTHSKKGRTVMNESERYEAVKHCRYVDEIVRDAPWEVDERYVLKHKIDFIAHDDIPYGSDDSQDVYAPWKARGMFAATERTEGVSTSDIVARIVRDYDIYVRRNLARGYSAKDLNISYLSEKKIRLQNKMHELKDKGRRVIDTIGERKDDMIAKWEEKSREFIENFLLLFGRERLTNIWNESKDKIMNALSPPSSPLHPGSPSCSSDDSDDEDKDEDYQYAEDEDREDQEEEEEEGQVSPPKRKSARYESPIAAKKGGDDDHRYSNTASLDNGRSPGSSRRRDSSEGASYMAAMATRPSTTRTNNDTKFYNNGGAAGDYSDEDEDFLDGTSSASTPTTAAANAASVVNIVMKSTAAQTPSNGNSSRSNNSNSNCLRQQQQH